MEYKWHTQQVWCYIKKQWNPESHLAMMLDKYDPDIVAFNETKCSDEHTVIFDNEPALSGYKVLELFYRKERIFRDGNIYKA